jgi:hypothetical protein
MTWQYLAGALLFVVVVIRAEESCDREEMETTICSLCAQRSGSRLSQLGRIKTNPSKAVSIGGHNLQYFILLMFWNGKSEKWVEGLQACSRSYLRTKMCPKYV